MLILVGWLIKFIVTARQCMQQIAQLRAKTPWLNEENPQLKQYIEKIMSLHLGLQAQINQRIEKKCLISSSN